MSDHNKNIGANDDPSSAPESGDQKETGRNRGQVVEAQPNRDAKDRSTGTSNQPEEGRHDAAPRTGG
jgi:hypothetical protein